MKVFMTGGTGFVGRYLTQKFTENGHSVVVASRNPARQSKRHEDTSETPAGSVTYVQVGEDMSSDMKGCRVVINLAGESLYGKRWTADVKEKIYNSRIAITRSLVSSMRKLDKKPDVLISASGVNYYGDSGDNVITEGQEPGTEFLSEVCLDWEAAALEIEDAGVRVVTPRFGVVLGTGGGALSLMLPVFKAFLGGSVGSGKQFFPWIHIHDLYRSILFAIETGALTGPYNAVAPNPVTMDSFAKALGGALSRPSIFKVPEFGITAVLGSAAGTLVLTSLRVIPEKITEQGFVFEYKDIDGALAHLLAS